MNANRLTKSVFGRARCPQRAEMLFPRITRITADMNWLRKTTVGRRCDQKTLRQRFLAQPDGQHGLRPCAANAAQFSSSPPKSVLISVHKWLKCMNPNPRSSAPSAGKNLTSRCFGHKRTQSTQRGFLYDLCDPSWQKFRPVSAFICACPSKLGERSRVHSRLKTSVVRMYRSLCVLRDLCVQTPILIRVHLRSSAVKNSDSKILVPISAH
jgi:hypothetical protein